MEIRVLGPTELVGGPLIARRKLRALLALLAAETGRTVTTNDLIDGLWGEQPPPTAGKTLQTYILQLRALLPAGSVVTDPGGYRLALDPTSVDAERFTDLVTAASQQLNEDPEAAERTYTAALSLWQGVPYADVDEGDLVPPRRTRLEETRLMALEGRAEARLALGRSREIVLELRDLVAKHPLRERLWELLMLALYRSGRQGDALRTYQDARHRLAEELGIEPGPALQRLEQQILNQDPQLLTDQIQRATPPPTPQVALDSRLEAEQKRTPRPTRTQPGVGQETRKTITVVFADVTGSTALGERLDPEALRRVMSRYFEEMQVVVHSHGGSVQKFIGDAVVAVFGIPRLHEDDALRALTAATEMRHRLKVLNEHLEAEFGVLLEMGIGVNSGTVVASGDGAADGLVLGDAVNVAARLEQSAEPGEILLGPETRELAGNGIEVEPVSPLELKGKSKALAAYRLRRILPDASIFQRRTDTPFVGRSDDVARIDAEFGRSVTERRCRLVMVLGPAGIGKSRLATQAAVSLRERATVLVGRCLHYGEGITFWPLREIFAAAGAEEELSIALGAGSAEDIFWAVRKHLEQLARERPLLLVIDDIHWAEPTMLELIQHLTDWTRDASILLLCLARPELLEAPEVSRGGWSSANVIHLEPLSDDESDRLIDELAGAVQLDEDLRRKVLEAAAGNPLFVEQLMAMLAEGGTPKWVPPTIHALIAARIDALNEHERAILEHASVVGLEFEWEALGELSTGGRPSGTHLATLVQKELISPHELIADMFRFRHILIRDAAYERIPKKVRANLHERVAAWLEDRGEEFEEIVGYHLEQAYRSLTDLGVSPEQAKRLADRAARHLSASGQRAFDRGDMGATANLLNRAASLFPPGDRRRLSFLPLLGRALVEHGEWDQAWTILTEAVEVGREKSEDGVVADAAVALAELRLHQDAHASHDQVRRELVSAVAEFERSHDVGGMARALCLAGKLSFWRGQTKTAANDLEGAAQYARDAGDRATEVESLRMWLAAALYGETPVTSVLTLADEIGRRGQGNNRLQAFILAVRGLMEGMAGRFDIARDLLSQARALGEELGIETVLAANILPWAGRVELLANDPVAAERFFRPAAEILQQMRDWGHLDSVAPLVADALIDQGRLDEAATWIDISADHTISDDLDASINWRRARAKLLARQGDLESGERFAREAAALAASIDYLNLHAQTLSDLAEILRLAGNWKHAERCLKEAVELYERKGNVVETERLRARLVKSPQTT